MAGAVAAVAVFGQLALIEAVLLAIVLAPTDAALGQAVVTDARVPSRIRQGLNVESGLNDGICVPLLLIAIAIAQAEEGAIGNGAAVHLVLEEIGYGCLAGVVAGLAAAAVVRVGVLRRLVDPIWLQFVPVAGAGLAYGLAVWMGGSGFIAAFVGGAVFGGLRREVGGEVTLFLEEAGGLLGAVTFVLFGAVMLVPVLDDLSASIVLYALLSLTVVRMVPVVLAMLGRVRGRPRSPSSAGSARADWRRSSSRSFSSQTPTSRTSRSCSPPSSSPSPSRCSCTASRQRPSRGATRPGSRRTRAAGRRRRSRASPLLTSACTHGRRSCATCSATQRTCHPGRRRSR